jgi:hypothetical protein
MRHSELNTNYGSSEKIWLQKTIAFYGFKENVLKNTIEDLSKFLEDAKALAEAGAYQQVQVSIDVASADYDGACEHRSLDVIGFRIETDNEYKRRLMDEIERRIEEKKSFIKRKEYYEGVDGAVPKIEQKISELLKIVSKL